MRYILIIFFLLNGLNLAAQTKAEIIHNLEKTFKSHSSNDNLKNVEFFYNTEEKILDFGHVFDLNTTKITYYGGKTPNVIINALKFEKLDSTGVYFPFDSKKSAYEVMDLIYQLKKIE